MENDQLDKEIALYEQYSLESVRYLASNDLLLVKFAEIDSMHIVDNVSLSIRSVKQSELPKEKIWEDLEVTNTKISLPRIDAELSSQQLYNLIYKRKAGISLRESRLI